MKDSLRETLRDMLIDSYKFRSMPDVRCALCGEGGKRIALNIIQFYHDSSFEAPAALVPMSESRGTRRGSVPVCERCCPECTKCKMPIATSWISKMCGLLQASFPRITFRLGNGICTHIHPLWALTCCVKKVELPGSTLGIKGGV